MRISALLLPLVLLGAARAAGDAAFDAAVDGAAPNLPRRATVILADTRPDGTLSFRTTHYKGEGDANDFWPASTIKLYAVLAALEMVHEAGFTLDVTASFEHRDAAGTWVPDCARTLKEMLSEVFVRSSNEDYTLLLRMTGRDRINSKFLSPERGFQKSALMRGYVLRRPYVYLPDEPQRITLRAADGTVKTVEHTWSGRVWSQERGATIIDPKTGNCTSTADMAECLRRLMFHEAIPGTERFRIPKEMVDFVRYGAAGLCGLETKGSESGPYAWAGSGELIFPAARYFHKGGRIETYVLDLACLDDRPQSGRAVILAASAASGQPAVMKSMTKALLEWSKAQPKEEPDAGKPK